MANPKVCSIEGCNKPVDARGWCAAHWWRWRKHGHPLGGRTPEGEPLRFYRDVVLSWRGDACLFWPFGKRGNGYGTLTVNRTMEYVHRLACAAYNGPSPSPRHYAAHNCGKGHLGCVNPTHLRWATPAENSHDMLAHGTYPRGCRRSSLTEWQVRKIRALHGKERAPVLAKRFGVRPHTIHDVWSRKSWGWLE